MVNSSGVEHSYASRKKTVRKPRPHLMGSNRDRERDMLMMRAYRELDLSVWEVSLLTGVPIRTLYYRIDAMKSRGEELLRGA